MTDAMTFSLPFWSIPLAMTVVFWTAAICWPLPPGGGSYDFGTPIRAALHLTLALIATLVVWLVFFMVF
ncbi:hypothetical protein IWC96_14665 [Brevundimonas sp. BAL450]|uniref:hypothetical protein n=1 Tax=Brevundimonas sp. BAL450 TaxID=1708162 RepID=UPI0018C90AF2|nr:hypothetical protein [Brevundimonas sp. BAL450]MBG7616518.1 hypothetical protein [Brevundimonas sp. BAL450]